MGYEDQASEEHVRLHGKAPSRVHGSTECAVSVLSQCTLTPTWPMLDVGVSG